MQEHKVVFFGGGSNATRRLPGVGTGVGTGPNASSRSRRLLRHPQVYEEYRQTKDPARKLELWQQSCHAADQVSRCPSPLMKTSSDSKPPCIPHSTTSAKTRRGGLELFDSTTRQEVREGRGVKVLTMICWCAMGAGSSA